MIVAAALVGSESRAPGVATRGRSVVSLLSITHREACGAGAGSNLRMNAIHKLERGEEKADSPADDSDVHVKMNV